MSPRTITYACLLLVGLPLAAGNVWFAAKRSTIPLQLDARVVRKEVRREKHPGEDDVFLLQLSPGRLLQVDEALFRAVNEGAALRKDAWSRRLEANGRTIELGWSCDFRGMLIAMPTLFVILAATIFWQRRAICSTPASDR